MPDKRAGMSLEDLLAQIKQGVPRRANGCVSRTIPAGSLVTISIPKPPGVWQPERLVTPSGQAACFAYQLYVDVGGHVDVTVRNTSDQPQSFVCAIVFMGFEE